MSYKNNTSEQTLSKVGNTQLSEWQWEKYQRGKKGEDLNTIWLDNGEIVIHFLKQYPLCWAENILYEVFSTAVWEDIILRKVICNTLLFLPLLFQLCMLWHYIGWQFSTFSTLKIYHVTATFIVINLCFINVVAHCVFAFCPASGGKRWRLD